MSLTINLNTDALSPSDKRFLLALAFLDKNFGETATVGYAQAELSAGTGLSSGTVTPMEEVQEGTAPASTDETAAVAPEAATDAAPKKTRAPRKAKDTAPPPEATEQTAALDSTPPTDVASLLEDATPVPADVPAEDVVVEEVEAPEPEAPSDMDAELLALMGEPEAPPADAYDAMTQQQLNGVFLERVKSLGGPWFRDAIFARGAKATSDLKREDYLAIVRQADADIAKKAA